MADANREAPASAKYNYTRGETYLIPALSRLRKFTIVGRGTSIGKQPGFLYVVHFDDNGRILAGQRLQESVLSGLVSCGEYECEERVPEGAYSYIAVVEITDRRKLHLYRRPSVH